MSDPNVPEPPDDVAAVVRAALAEDIGSGDLTALLLPADSTASAEVITREACVVCGRPWFDEVFAQIDPAVTIEWRVDEGARAAPDTLLCRLRGASRSLVTG
ncbi:MAG: nicotinate-nucleotide diphosphorylase, partial [Gammaproteobacteria bacterium]|nr:nicotinate-nucleotide diphosphorylase [Gammaproteobacteria bacterium]